MGKTFCASIKKEMSIYGDPAGNPWKYIPLFKYLYEYSPIIHCIFLKICFKNMELANVENQHLFNKILF